MTSLSWVIGGRGLLGSAVTRRLIAQGERTLTRQIVRWETPRAVSDLREGLARLIDEADHGAGWRVYWCAGVGVTGSSADSLRAEVARFQALIDAIRLLPGHVQSDGTVFVASSAGAVYAGSTGAPFDEATLPHPIAEYGHAKLAIEAAAQELAEATEVRCLVGRIANLYGPGQSLAKPQGLISHLCLAYLKRRPLSVYVPLDTLRDYVFVDDCAALIVDASMRLSESATVRYRMKVLASGRSVSIGALIGEFRRVIGRRPEIVMGSSAVSALHSRDLRVRSVIWEDLDHRPKTNLADGIARTLQDIRKSSFTST